MSDVLYVLYYCQKIIWHATSSKTTTCYICILYNLVFLNGLNKYDCVNE